jgi:hypothetical protein
VPEGPAAAVKKFCTTADAVLLQMFVKEAKLKPRAKANVRAAMTTSYGVLKMVYQKSLKGDPLVIRRIQDTQDNLAKVELLAKNHQGRRRRHDARVSSATSCAPSSKA